MYDKSVIEIREGQIRIKYKKVRKRKRANTFAAENLLSIGDRWMLKGVTNPWSKMGWKTLARRTLV